MEIITTQHFKIKDITLICSLPDMGKVGGLVTQHLTKHLQTKEAGKIILSDKPWVNLKNGVIDLPHDEYKVMVDEKNAIVIFTGENQPQEPSTVFDIANSLLDFAKKMGNIKMIISAGGYLPNEQNNGNEVYGVATNSEALDKIKVFDVKPLSSEVKSITWFNGVILGIAKNQKINGIGLFGEIVDVESPQYKAARNIVKTIEKILKIQIPIDELENKIVDKPVEVKKEGPGIG